MKTRRNVDVPAVADAKTIPNGSDLPFYVSVGSDVKTPYNEIGVCASCRDGRHEIPPERCYPIDNLIAAHESVLKQLKEVRKDRKAISNDG